MHTIKTVNPIGYTHPMIIVAATAVTLASVGVIAKIGGWLPQSSASTSASADPIALTAPDSAIVAPVANQVGAANPAVITTTRPAPPIPTPTRKVGAGETAPRPIPATASSPRPPGPIGTSNASTAYPPPPPAATAPVSAKTIPADYSVQTMPPAPTVPTVPIASSPADTRRPAAVCRDCGVIESIEEIAVEGSAGPLGAIAGGVVGSIIGNQIGNGSQRTAARLIAMAGGAYAGHQIEKSNKRSVRYETHVRFDDGTSQRIASTERPAWRGGDAVRLVDGQIQSRY